MIYRWHTLSNGQKYDVIGRYSNESTRRNVICSILPILRKRKNENTVINLIYAANQLYSSKIITAHFSPIMIEGAFVLAFTMLGIIDASAILNPFI